MIQTTTACYGSRGNGMQKVYMKALIPEDTGDGFNIVIIDYMIIDDVEKEIYRKSVYMSYAERDALKSAVVAGYSLTGTESEINKQLIPYAVLYRTKSENPPTYMIDTNEWILL
jgi:hypothetical protein